MLKSSIIKGCMNKWMDLSKIGWIKEKEFGQLLVNNYGGEVKKASKNEDMYNHIDLKWKYKDKEYTFDIKGAKKSNRADTTPDYTINWIELQNVRGKPGWIFGKADYIVFETIDSWFIVKRTDIIKFIDSKVTDRSISKSKDLYTCYQRDGRQDIVVKVLTNDLYNIAKKIINKD